MPSFLKHTRSSISKEINPNVNVSKLSSNTKTKFESMRHVSPKQSAYATQNPSVLMTSGRSGSLYTRLNSQGGSITKTSKLRNEHQPREANVPITEARIKKDLISAFKRIRLDVFSDILRIKQPQKVALNTGSMLCKIVNSFRGGSQKSNSDPMFVEWS